MYNGQNGMPSNVFAIYRDIYNHIAGRNSKWQIGSRYLGIGANRPTETGTVMGQTSRTFVTHPSENNRAIITLEKTGGKAKTSVVVCVINKNGSSRSLPVYTFSNGNGTSTKRFTVNNVKDKIIVVSIKNKSVGNKFKYKISAR